MVKGRKLLARCLQLVGEEVKMGQTWMKHANNQYQRKKAQRYISVMTDAFEVIYSIMNPLKGNKHGLGTVHSSLSRARTSEAMKNFYADHPERRHEISKRVREWWRKKHQENKDGSR